MTVRLEPRFRPAVDSVRLRLGSRERALFDLLCAAGQLGRRLPYNSANLALVSGKKDPRLRLASTFEEFFATELSDARALSTSSVRLKRWLLSELRARKGENAFHLLRVLLGNATIALAPDCVVPKGRVLRAAWKTVVGVFAQLYPSQVKALGRLEWISDRRLKALRRETLSGLQQGRAASGQRPGPEGRKLAVDRRLMTEVGAALGRTVEPGFEARYVFYSRPGDHFWPHPDDPEYDVNILVCLDRGLPPGESRGSAFLAFGPDGGVDRYELAPGSALAVEAQGLVHGREPMRVGESVTMLSIAARCATTGSAA